MGLTIIKVGNDKALFLHNQQIASYCSQSDDHDCHEMLESTASNLSKTTRLPLERRNIEPPLSDWNWDDIEQHKPVYSGDHKALGLSLELSYQLNRDDKGNDWSDDYDEGLRLLYEHSKGMMLAHNLSID